MRQITDINELHNILLDIAKEIHAICVKNKIPYYMLGGTMLGAVRHKGFIPWDDDMDFGVPRKYWVKLKEVLSKELPSNYRVLTIDDTPSILSGIIKIEDKRTAIKEKMQEYPNEEGCIGVNVDIFPLDTTNTNKSIFSKNSLMVFLIKLNAYIFLPVNWRPIPNRLIAYFFKILFCFQKRTTFINIVERIMSKMDGEAISNIYGAWGMREIVPSVFFKAPILYDFESIQLYGLTNADSYLQCLYGNYMQLPPENKRHIHITGIWIK